MDSEFPSGGPQEDLSSGPLEERLKSKAWKVRQAAYKEVAAEFTKCDSTDPLGRKYQQQVPKWIVETTAIPQEDAYDAVLAYVDAFGSDSEGFTTSLIEGLVAKGFTTRPKTRVKAQELCLLLTEVGSGKPVAHTLLTVGTKSKTPKVVIGSVEFLYTIVKTFGGKPFDIKEIGAGLPTMFGSANAAVREWAHKLAVTVYQIAGPAPMHQWLKDIKPIQLAELEKDFRKAEHPLVPLKQLRGAGDRDGANNGTDGPSPMEFEEKEPEEYIDDTEPYDFLSNMPDEFYENIVLKAWLPRKEALSELKTITDHPKLTFGPEMHTLLQKLAKLILDVNVHVCIEAAGCIAHIANGTKAQFGTQAIHVLPPILKRMKEKKATVLTALNEAAKAVLKTVSLDSIAPELLPFITDKNPSIRKETLVVTAFAITQTTLKILNKSLIKQLAELIIKVTSDSAAPVREAAYEALGAMQRVAGDRPMAPYLSDLDKLKQDKIKDYCDKCTGVKSSANASRPVAPREPIKATPAVASKKAIPTKDPPAMPAPAETKTAAAPKGRVAAPPAVAANPKPAQSAFRSVGVEFPGVDDIDDEQPLEDETVATLTELSIPEAVRTQVASKVWKERLEGMTELIELVKADSENPNLSPQVLFRFLAKTPGTNEANFQVWGKMFDLVNVVCTTQAHRTSRRAASYIIPGLVNKIGDMKCGQGVKGALSAVCEAVGQSYVVSVTAQTVMEGSNVKNYAHTLSWVGGCVVDFGLKCDMDMHVKFVKTAVSHSNATIRKEVVQLLRTLFTYTGEGYRRHFEDEKAAMVENIDRALKAALMSTPDAPTRFEYKEDSNAPRKKEVGGQLSAGSALTPADGLTRRVTAEITQEFANMGVEDGGDGNHGNARGDPMQVQDEAVSHRTVHSDEPRTDVSPKLGDALCNQLNDSDWKTRQEALMQVQTILKQAGKHVADRVGGLPTALKQRLHDSNKNLIALALQRITLLVESMGPGCEQVRRVLLPGVLSALSDKKLAITSAAVEALTAFNGELGPLALLDEVQVALDSQHSQLRTHLLGWVLSVLQREGQGLPQGSLIGLVRPVLLCSQDRMSGVRTLLHKIVPYLVLNCGVAGVNQEIDRADTLASAKSDMRDVVTRFGQPPKPAAPKGVSSQVSVVSSQVPESTPGAETGGAGYEQGRPSPHKHAPGAVGAVAGAINRSGGRSVPTSGGSTRRSLAAVTSKIDSRRSISGIARPGFQSGIGSSIGTGPSPKRSSSINNSSSRSALPKFGGVGWPPEAGHPCMAGDDVPLSMMPGDIKQREMKNLRSRWECHVTGPRDDHMAQLKEQMQMCVKEPTLSQLWSSDPRLHAVALETLTATVTADPDTQGVPPGLEEAKVCSDVLLKYASIRLCDKITTAILKTLVFLKALIGAFIADGHRLEAYEASLIFPMLVLKIGEKEMVQREARSVIRSFCNVHPSMNIFTYLMDGIKSKNAKVRAASIEEIGYLIKRYTISVCQPSPQVALHTIAQTLDDKDKSVRDQSMAVIVLVYSSVGEERLWRYLGQLSSRCVSYLQEKLKRHPAPDAGTVVGFNGTPSRIPVRSPSRAPASSSGYGQIQRNADPSSATDLDGRHGNTTPTRGESLSFRSGPGVSSRGMSISPERSPYYTQPQATTPQSAKAYRNYAPTHNQPQPDLDAYDHPDSHSHPHVPPHRSVQESPFVHVHASKPIRMPPTPADRVAKKVTLEWDSPEDTLAHKGHFPDLAPTYMSSDDSSFILPTRHQADPKFGSVSAASLGMGRQRLGEDLYEDMDVDSHSLSPVRNLGQSALGYDSTISGASAAIDSTYTSTTYGYAHTNTDTQRISALNSGAGAGIKTDPHVAAPAPVQTHVAVLSYLATVGTESPTLAVKTLKECARSLKDHPERWGVPEFEELLQACSLHLSRINTAASANATALSDPAVSARLCRHTVHAIQQLYSDCKLSMRQVSSVVVEPLLLTVIEATTTHKHSREAYSDRDRREIAKALESLQPTIVRGHPPSVMLLSLMGSLNQTTRNADSKLVDKLSSFAIQLIRMLDAHDTQTIAWAPIFTAMNYFLTAFPVHSWQDRALWRYSEEDKPLRVVERLATLVVQHEGVASKKHVEGFAENAPVAVYMTHLLARTLGPSGPVNGHDILPGQTQSQPPRDNATTHTDPRAQQIHALPEVQVQTQEPQQKAISKEIADQVHAITSKLPSDLFEAGKKMAHIFIEHPEAESVLETNISHLSEHFQDYFRRDIRAHIDTLRNELGVPAPSDRLIITPLNSQVEEPQPTKSHHASLEFANTGTIVGLAGAHTRDRTTSAMNLDILGHGSTPLADVEPPRSSAHISELAALLKTKVRSQAQDYPSARTSQAAGGASVYDTSYALNAALYDSNATQHGPLSAPVQSDLKATLKESLARQTNR